MEESWIWPAIALSGLVILSAFFSGSETALIGSGRVSLNLLAEKGSRGAKRALRLIKDPGELLGIILVGNNLVNVMAAALATVILGPLYATILITLVLLIFAEITPKTLNRHLQETKSPKGLVRQGSIEAVRKWLEQRREASVDPLVGKRVGVQV